MPFFTKKTKVKEIAIIGHITDASRGIKMVTESGMEMEIKARGWNGLA